MLDFIFGFILVLFFFNVYCENSFQSCQVGQPVINIKQGTICGVSAEVEYNDRSASTVHIYYGIPYAKPPLKNLRFKKPEPLSKFRTKVINATQHKPACHQYNDTSYLNNPAAKMWVSPIPYDEDCLYLNVWVPQNEAPSLYSNRNERKEKLPVMVWIYGGSFAMGTAALEVYEGRYLATRQNVIVVSINYRLGPFGFIYLGNRDVPGNMGLWDQRLALKWVKENIEYFDGDPEKITIFGESAGAVSVSAHVISPWSQNLFKNAIMESGSVLGYWGLVTRNISYSRTLEFMKQLGCVRRTIAGRIECMRQLPADRLTDTHSVMYDLKSYFSVPFPPVVEGYFFPYSTSQAFRNLAHLKPSGSLMFGMNKNEGSYFLLYAFISDSFWFKNHTDIEITSSEDYYQKLRKVLDLDVTTPSSVLALVDFEYTNVDLPNASKFLVQRLEEISSDRSFKCPTIEMARLVTNDHRFTMGPGKRSVTLPTYFYEFKYRTQSLPWPQWMGTIHGLEIDYVFGVPFNKKFQNEFYKFNKEEQRISDGIMQYWANFARFGDPNIMPNNTLVSDKHFSINGKRLSLWPEFDNVTGSYLTIDDDGNFRTSTHPKNRKCTFWWKWYPVLLQEAKRQMMTACT